MKKINIIFFCVLLSIVISCQHDEATQSGNVQFSFSTKSFGSSSGRKQADVMSEGASLVISLSKSNGDTVFTWKNISLLKIGDQFITEPLPLLPGSYRINDFMIRSSNNTLLFIAPKEGSPLASLVTKPLPVSFTVNGNTVVNTEVEVVNADHQNPEDFGYAAFPIKVIPGSGFSVSAFISDKGQTTLTTARAYILHEHDTLLKQNLNAAVNNVNWNKGDIDHFSLVIVKDGYARYQKDFSLDSMMTYLGGKPLPVVLAPAFTISWTPWRAYDGSLFVSITAPEGSTFRIDWGDGKIERYEHHPTLGGFRYAYAEPTRHFMSVTGDLDAITSLHFYYQIAKIDTLSIVSLPNLTYFGMNFFGSYLGKGIDLSHNSKLEILDFSYQAGNLSMVDISKNRHLQYVNLMHLNLSTAAVDKVIDDLFKSIVLENIHGGGLNLSAENEYTPVIIGPPSDSSMSKLNQMINFYGWSVYPLTQP